LGDGNVGAKLSGGQKQRLAISRTFLKNPSILILDEITSALDTENEANVQLALETIMKGRTTFIITHKLSTIKNADIILHIQDGQVKIIKF
jgi:ABC-type multidrug transport system fused ATPase/permease subunit